MDTLALTAAWDLDVDASGNWRTVGDATPGAQTGPGMRLAQDVATRCLVWYGELYYDTTQGIRYPTYLGGVPNLTLLQSAFAAEARKVNGCSTALPAFTFTAGSQRQVTGSLTVSDANGNGGTVTF